MSSTPFVTCPGVVLLRTLAVCTLLLACVAASPVRAEVILDVDLGPGMADAERVDAMRAALARRGVEVDAPLQADARWHEVLLIEIDEAWDARFVASIPALHRGRNLYYDARFEDAIQALEPWLERVEQDPSVLSLHPDLVAPFVDAMMALAAAWDAVGDHDTSQAILARLARVVPAVELDPTLHAGGTIERWETARADVVVRHVTPDGARGACELLHAGVPVADPSSGLPWTGEGGLVRLRCDGRVGALYRVRPDNTVLDASLDDALVVQRGRVSLRPRAAGDAEDLAALGRAAARALDVDAVVLAAVRPGGRSALTAIEWIRVTADGDMRAARTTVDATEADLDAAAAWLTGGPEPGAVSVWRDGEGWTPGPGDVFIPDVPRAATWITASVAIAGIGAASFLEVQRADDASALTSCGTDRACTSSGDIDDRRDDLRQSRRIANIAWAGAGTLVVGAIVTAAVQSPSVRFRERQHAARVMPGVGPRRVTLRLEF